MDKTPRKSPTGHPGDEIYYFIFRCRLIRVSPISYIQFLKLSKSDRKKNYFEVWDTVGRPYGDEKKLPQGDVIAEAQSLYLEVVKKRMRAHRQRFSVKGFQTRRSRWYDNTN